MSSVEISQAFKFCPRCGVSLRPKPHYLKCPACGLTFYLNPKPVQSIILLNDKEEILFVVRSIEPREGYLDFPGGFMEAGENFEETTRRELKEELGITVGTLEYLSTHTDEYLFDGINYPTSGVTYLAKLPNNAKLKPADDVASVEFYKLADIPIERLAWPSMDAMLDKLNTKLG